MLAPLLRLMLLTAVLLASATATAFVGEGQKLGDWKVTRTEAHSEYFRVWVDGPGGETGMEVVADAGPAGDWNTGRHRLMPAPGHTPPPELLAAAMTELRAYDAIKGPPLAGGRTPRLPASTPEAPPPQPSRPGPPVRGPSGPWPVALVALMVALLAGASWTRPALRTSMIKADAWLERAGWPLLIVLLVAMATQSLAALGQPFGSDDMTQRVFFASLDLGPILRHEYHDARHPQLFYLVLHAALWLGHSEAIVRAPAAIFGLATAAALFALARPVLGTRGGLLAVALLALNTTFLLHSREVADITLFLFLMLGSTAVLRAALEHPEDRRLLVALVLVETAMFYSYYMAALAAVAQLVVIATYGRRGRHVWPTVPLVAVFCYPLVWRIRELASGDTEMRGLARLFPTHLWGDLGPTEILSQWAALMAPTQATLVVLVVLVPIGAARLGLREALGVWAISLATVSTALMAWAVLLVRLKAYYMLFVLPALLLLAVAAVVGRRDRPLTHDTRGAAQVGLGVGLAVLLLGLFGQHYVSEAPYILSPRDSRSFYRDLGQVIRSTPDGPGAVVADPNALHTMLLYYAFEDPLPMYRTCQLPEDGSGTRCQRGDEALYTLTAAPKLEEGWEARSMERLAVIQAREPTWVVYTTFFANELLLDHVEDRCAAKGSWYKGQVSLWNCPKI